MSELTSCNFCTLKAIKAYARKQGKKVSILPAPDGGIAVYVHWPDEKPEARPPGLRGPFACWFMELTDHCVC